jgi:hypothetical protein
MRSLGVYVWCVVLVLGFASGAGAQEQVRLAWDPSPDPDVTGYLVSWGPREGQYTSSVDVGPRTDWTISGLDPIQRYYFTVQAYDATRALSERTPPVENGGLGVQGNGFLQDQRPSLFWRNTETGDLRTWHLSGLNVVDTRSLTIPGVADTTWKIVGTGDLNGDGFTDILWRHDGDGALAAWFLSNNWVIQTGYLSIPTVADPGWRVAGVGDTDGDRFADVVWQHNDGRLAVWFMRGMQVVLTRVMNTRVADTSWRVVAVGDINNDRRADLVWRSPDGSIAGWMLQGATVISGYLFSVPRVDDLAWRIVAAGKTDGVSPPALVWQHDTGGIALWYVNGLTVVSTGFLNPTTVFDTDWKIVGAR